MRSDFPGVPAHAAGSERRTGRGRPRKVIEWRYVEYLASMGATSKEIAEAVGVGLTTLESRPTFREAVARGVYLANVSIRRVLFGVLRGQLIDPATGRAEKVPMEERISMAKYLANLTVVRVVDGDVGPVILKRNARSGLRYVGHGPRPRVVGSGSHQKGQVADARRVHRFPARLRAR